MSRSAIPALPEHRGDRIAILIDTKQWGGAEVHTAELARALAGRGHQVTLALLHQVVEDRFIRASGGVCRVVTLDTARAEVRGVAGWRQQLRALGSPTGVLAKNWLHAGSLAFDIAARLTFSRYATIEHLTPPPAPRYPRLRQSGRRVPGLGLWWVRQMGAIWLRGRCPHRIFTVSHAVQTALVREYRFPAHRMLTIHNGIDGERFIPSPERRHITRGSWRIPDEAVVFGTVGRLDNAHKGLELAIAAFSEVAGTASGVQPRLIVVGDGPDRPALEAQARATPCAGLITFTGSTDTPEVAYPAIDFLLMPSRFEGLPLSLMEAMACGCCPIATRVSGIPEIIDSSALGWLVERDDVSGLVKSMHAAIGLTPDARQAMSGRVRERIRTHFSGTTQFSRLAEAIERLMTGSRGPATAREVATG